MTAAALPLVRRRRRAHPMLTGIGWAGQLAIVVIIALALIAFLAPWIAPQDPNAIDLSSAFQGPSAQHLLGTDASGRDLLSRLIWGSRSSLLGPLVVVAMATALGTALGVTSAWRGGWFDSVVARIIDVMFAFPGVLLAIVVVALFGAGLAAAVGALIIAYIPYVAKVVRSAALREIAQPYILALTIQGVSGLSICVRHLLPNVGPLVVAQSTIAFGYAMVDLAALSFLGLGVQPPTSDWGVMVAEGQPSILQGFPQQSLYASALIVVAVGAFNTLGDRLEKRTGQVL